MTNAIIDFESYYGKDINVVEVGNRNYVRDSYAYIVGVWVDGQEPCCGTLKEMGPMCEQIAADPTVRPIAANANFDQEWWEKDWPEFKQPWHCILDQAAFHQLPRNLAGLSQSVLGKAVDKTVRDEMRDVHYGDLPAPRQIQVQEYCLGDIVAEGECFQQLPPMSPIEEQIALHTRMTNRRGIAINEELVASDKTKIEAMRFDAFKKIPWHNDAKPLSYPAFVKYCQGKGLPVPASLDKGDDACTEMMVSSPELKAVIDEMRRYRRANSILKKIGQLGNRITDGILMMELIYCGAPHTRRWSSRGFNIQNLDKEPVDLGTGDTVWSRKWLVPRPGKIFYIVDFMQIEPRCLNWLVENDEMMEALRHGFSYYEAYIRAAHQEARVGWSGKPGTMKKEVGLARYTKIKNESLGCGYGMGADKYTTYADVPVEEAKQVITGFRKNNPKIVKFWRKLDNLIGTAARDKAKHLGMTMPSGDLLQYFNVRCNKRGHEGFVVKGDFGQMSKQPRLWGGTLTENVTQRMARDILAYATVRLEQAGLPVIFTSHDEGILELDDDSSKEKARAEADRILMTPPGWASDLPLGIEGQFSTHYTK